MTDDLGRRLDALAQRMPDGSPEVGPVVAGGRRLRRRRSATGTVGIMAVVSALIIAGTNLDLTEREANPVRPATHEDGLFVPAQEGEATYVLETVEIRYPFAKVDGMSGFRPGSQRREDYCSMPQHRNACSAKGNAGYFYRWEWSTDLYPGIVTCRVILFSRDDQVVGQGFWELTGLESSSRRATDVLVHVTKRPVRADAECEAGTSEGGPGYRFTYVRSERVDNRTRLFFDLEILVEHQPFTRNCTLRVRFENGKTERSSFTLTGAREGPFHMDTSFSVRDPVEDARLTCRPFKRELRT